MRIFNIFFVQSIISLFLFNLATLYDLKAHFQSNIIVSYMYVFYELVPSGTVYNINYYKSRIKSLMSLNPVKLTNLYTVISNQVLVSRYQMSYYDDFLFKILSGNMCEALRDFPEFIDSSTFSFDYNICTTVQNSILTSGF